MTLYLFLTQSKLHKQIVQEHYFYNTNDPDQMVLSVPPAHLSWLRAYPHMDHMSPCHEGPTSGAG